MAGLEREKVGFLALVTLPGENFKKQFQLIRGRSQRILLTSQLATIGYMA
jgi:hypothetical protein